MKTILSALVALFFLFHIPAQAAENAPRTVYVVQVKAVITPASYDFIHRNLEMAAQNHAAAIVIELDTPGGLMDSMKDIIQDILASSVPVITYVSPSGAHAASAGTYIMYASHIAAMAPGTNLGAATPITMDKPDATAKSVLETKMSNDAAAYIHSLATLRQRNVEWAEKAVYQSVSLSATDALKEHVVDLIASNVDDLLIKVDGRTVKIGDTSLVLKTKGAAVERIEPDWRMKLISIITNPNITFLLMTIGAYGIIAEFSHPGAFFPGILGAICLLLGMYALNVLPINYTGLGLILLGIGCMTAEAFMPSFGVLGLGGAAAFAIGALLLFDPASGLSVSYSIIALLTLTSLGFFSVLLSIAIRARKRPVSTGAEAMTGSIGEVAEWHQTDGTARVAGTIWKAKSSTAFILKKGDKVKVLAVEGLCLIVQPAHS